MIETNGEWMDTWCQAKYSTEVFAGMLGENDSMNIYLMSDFNADTNAGPFLTLKGADGMATNVEKVHNMLGPANNTPFNSVRKAYADLTKATADEKWLVVLTDGQFQGVDDIDAFFGGVLSSGRSSFCYLQNVYTTKNVEEQGLSLALCLCEGYLSDKKAAFRVHGGGFAGTVQAFVPSDAVNGFKAIMDSAFGEGACLVLRVRREGAVRVL
jgi:hypothetical protein